MYASLQPPCIGRLPASRPSTARSGVCHYCTAQCVTFTLLVVTPLPLRVLFPNSVPPPPENNLLDPWEPDSNVQQSRHRESCCTRLPRMFVPLLQRRGNTHNVLSRSFTPERNLQDSPAREPLSYKRVKNVHKLVPNGDRWCCPECVPDIKRSKPECCKKLLTILVSFRCFGLSQFSAQKCVTGFTYELQHGINQE